jgi:hypothetical protein
MARAVPGVSEHVIAEGREAWRRIKARELQSAVKPAASAMIEARSQDWYVLARRALEAAVRTRNDILELLADDPVPAKCAG